MLTRVDRMQLAVRDRAAAEETFRGLLGAEKVGEDRIELPQAERSGRRAGGGEVGRPEAFVTCEYIKRGCYDV